MFLLSKIATSVIVVFLLTNLSQSTILPDTSELRNIMFTFMRELLILQQNFVLANADCSVVHSLL